MTLTDPVHLGHRLDEALDSTTEGVSIITGLLGLPPGSRAARRNLSSVSLKATICCFFFLAVCNKNLMAIQHMTTKAPPMVANKKIRGMLTLQSGKIRCTGMLVKLILSLMIEPDFTK